MRRALYAAPLLLALTTTAFAATAKAPEVYPLAKVKQGQKGYGLTVFQGTEPKRFDFEVVGVMKNFLPKMDIILVKSDDPQLALSGFAQGMSGSPLFLDGKVLCAFSYGFRFNKIAMGGCTPLEYMVEESKTPLRGPEKTAMASADEWQKYAPLEAIATGRDAESRKHAAPDAWLMQSPLPTMPAKQDDDESGLVRAGVPLSVAGLGPTALEQAKSVFSQYGMEPMQAGGAGDDDKGPTQFEMGGPIGVVLARGDVSANGTGTVSYVDGHTILAFGHPMFQMGEAYFPISAAEIHGIIPSAQSAFKLASPLRVLGSLEQDRQSMIMGDTTKKFDMIPVDVKVVGPNGAKEFHSEVVRNRFLTPSLVAMAVVNGAQLLAPDVTDATVTITSTLQLKGYKPLAFTDYVYSPEGAAGNAIGSARALRILSPILFNPWSMVTVEKVAVDIKVEYKANVVNLQTLRLPDYEVPYGKKFYVSAEMQPFGGKNYWTKIPLTIPEKYAGATLKLEVVAGDGARLDIAPPENMEQLIDALRTSLPANTIAATIYVPDEGVTLNGQVLPELPDSAIDTVRPSTSTSRGESYKSMLRVVVPAKVVVQGRQEIVFKVADKK